MSTFIIAEAGVNHNGSLKIARRMVDVAAEAGADAVKFQTFNTESITTRHTPLAEYQKKAMKTDGSQFDLLKKLELSVEDHRELKEYCKERGIEFLSTPFDLPSVRLLVEEVGVQYIKISSGDVTNGPLLLQCAHSGKPIVLSTGMSTLGEIERALGVLAFGYVKGIGPISDNDFQIAYSSREGRKMLRKRVTLLHCTTSYPTPYERVNLRAMDTLRNAFGLTVGLSDHSMGIAVPVAAVARGAAVIEKHFTLDRSMDGPDHRASLEPAELQEMVAAIRCVERALGSPRKGPSIEEARAIGVARKSLVASASIQKGDLLTPENLTIKRPGTGISPMAYWDWLGRPADRDYGEDELIQV